MNVKFKTFTKLLCFRINSFFLIINFLIGFYLSASNFVNFFMKFSILIFDLNQNNINCIDFTVTSISES